MKLNEVTAEFDKRLGSCCDRMTNAWNERETMMNGIVARIIHFQVRAWLPLFAYFCLFAHQITFVCSPPLSIYLSTSYLSIYRWPCLAVG